MKKIYKNKIKNFYCKFEYSDIRKKIPNASFLFVTHNRCPFVDFNKNPLFWSLMTLINGYSESLNEIIIIDDASSDYTYKTVKAIKKETNYNIKYYKNNERKGCSYSRQVAIKESINNFVFMGDDDCLYRKEFVAGALVSYLDLIEFDSYIALLNLPVFERSTFPRYATDQGNIGKWNIEDTHFYHNFDKLPLQYLKNPTYTKDGVLSPFSIDIMYGVNLFYKRYVLNSGGYEDLSMWDNDYSEHMELAYKLNKNRYSLYHQPDPRFSAIHLKYGSKTVNTFDRRSSKNIFSGLKYNLGELIKYSQINRKSSGARINDYDFHINQIGSFFSFYVKISKELAVKFAVKEYNNFVLNNHIFSTTPSVKFSFAERKDIFRKAINIGVKVSSQQEGKCFEDVKKLIFNKI
ncbi:MAG: glycosyltransferase [Candidatus Woesearchaeota archaeon]